MLAVLFLLIVGGWGVIMHAAQTYLPHTFWYGVLVMFACLFWCRVVVDVCEDIDIWWRKRKGLKP